ncbi:MAG: sigma-B regulation protein RsbQ [Frankiales bacterium]|nr:sigma-B regulation protein RsbQ [Frankiales bacterium]
MSAAARHNVTFSGVPDGPVIVFAHGFGCDQRMWRHVAPRFADRFRVLTFDNMGAGGADPAGYDPVRHDSLDGYAEDVVQLCGELGVHDAVFVGHSVSSMIGALATIKAPGMFSRLVMVSPSARFIDEGDYVGGFTEPDIAELLDSLDSNYLGWSGAMAPVIMGNPDRPELGEELAASFCRTDPAVARQFARVTFLADNRADLSQVSVPTLVLQCSDDAIAPVAVGEYVRDALRDSTYVLLEATGHCPNLSAPEATVAAIEAFLAETLVPSQ